MSDPFSTDLNLSEHAVDKLIQENRSLAAELERLRKDNRDWQDATEEAEAELERLRSVDSEISDLLLDYDAAQAELERVKAERDAAMTALRIAAQPGGASPGWVRDQIAEIERKAIT